MADAPSTPGDPPPPAAATSRPPAACLRCGGFGPFARPGAAAFRICDRCFAWEPGPAARRWGDAQALPLAFVSMVFATFATGVTLWKRAGSGLGLFISAIVCALLVAATYVAWRRGHSAWAIEQLTLIGVLPRRLLDELRGPGAAFIAHCAGTRLRGFAPLEVVLVAFAGGDVLVYGAFTRVVERASLVSAAERHPGWWRLDRPGDDALFLRPALEVWISDGGAPRSVSSDVVLAAVRAKAGRAEPAARG